MMKANSFISHRPNSIGSLEVVGAFGTRTARTAGKCSGSSTTVVTTDQLDGEESRVKSIIGHADTLFDGRVGEGQPVLDIACRE